MYHTLANHIVSFFYGYTYLYNKYYIRVVLIKLLVTIIILCTLQEFSGLSRPINRLINCTDTFYEDIPYKKILSKIYDINSLVSVVMTTGLSL